MKIFDQTKNTYHDVKIPILASCDDIKTILSSLLYCNIHRKYIFLTFDEFRNTITVKNVFEEIYNSEIKKRMDIKSLKNHMTEVYNLDFSTDVLPILLYKYKNTSHFYEILKKERVLYPLFLTHMFENDQIVKITQLKTIPVFKKYIICVDTILRSMVPTQCVSAQDNGAKEKAKLANDFGLYDDITQMDESTPVTLTAQTFEIKYSPICLFDYFRNLKVSNKIVLAQYKNQYKLYRYTNATKDIITQIQDRPDNLMRIYLQKKGHPVELRISEDTLRCTTPLHDDDIITTLNQNNVIQINTLKKKKINLCGSTKYKVFPSFNMHLFKELIFNTKSCSLLYTICEHTPSFELIGKGKTNKLRCKFNHPLLRASSMISFKHYDRMLCVDFEQIHSHCTLQFMMYTLKQILRIYRKNENRLKKMYELHRIFNEKKICIKNQKKRRTKTKAIMMKPNNLNYEKKVPVILNDLLFSMLECPIKLRTVNTVKDKDSFLWCAQQARQTKPMLSVNQLRNKFMTDQKYLSMCKQECFHISHTEITNRMKHCFTPDYFKQIVEHYFNIGIIILEHDRLSTPRYTYRYFCKDFKHYILIYKQRQNKKVRYFHIQSKTSDQPLFSKEKVSILLRMSQYRVVHNVSFPSAHILFQHIDQNGKARRLYIEHKDQLITIHVTPLQPLYCLELPHEHVKNILQCVPLDTIKQISTLFKSKSNLVYTDTYCSWTLMDGVTMTIYYRNPFNLRALSTLSHYKAQYEMSYILKNGVLRVYNRLNVSFDIFSENKNIFIIKPSATIAMVVQNITKNQLIVPNKNVKQSLLHFLNYNLVRNDYTIDTHWLDKMKWKYVREHNGKEDQEIRFFNSYDIMSYVLFNHVTRNNLFLKDD